MNVQSLKNRLKPSMEASNFTGLADHRMKTIQGILNSTNNRRTTNEDCTGLLPEKSQRKWATCGDQQAPVGTDLPIDPERAKPDGRAFPATTRETRVANNHWRRRTDATTTSSDWPTFIPEE